MTYYKVDVNFDQFTDYVLMDLVSSQFLEFRNKIQLSRSTYVYNTELQITQTGGRIHQDIIPPILIIRFEKNVPTLEVVTKDGGLLYTFLFSVVRERLLIGRRREKKREQKVVESHLDEGRYKKITKKIELINQSSAFQLGFREVLEEFRETI